MEVCAEDLVSGRQACSRFASAAPPNHSLKADGPDVPRPELERYGLSVLKLVLRAERAFFVKKFVLRRVPMSASSSEFVEARWPVRVVRARQGAAPTREGP